MARPLRSSKALHHDPLLHVYNSYQPTSQVLPSLLLSTAPYKRRHLPSSSVLELQRYNVSYSEKNRIFNNCAYRRPRFRSHRNVDRIYDKSAGFGMEPFHLGCPYTSLSICRCSLYVREPPRYLQSQTALDTECNDDDTENMQRALLHDLMLAAGGDGTNPYKGPPSPRTLLAARAKRQPPEESLAEALAVAMHATRQSRTEVGIDANLGGSTPTSSSNATRGCESSPSDARQTASSPSETVARPKRVRSRPRKAHPQ